MKAILLFIMIKSLSGLRWYGLKGASSGVQRQCRLFSSTSSAIEDQPKSWPEMDITNNEMLTLGLSKETVQALQAQSITKPTPVQRTVIPKLLNRENLVMAAATGSGKTLAYVLPAIENMHLEEIGGYQRQAQRPRCLVLVPTRDLARQVLGCVKQVGHYSKVSSAAVIGGEQYALQKKSLERVVDIVVASPGRLLQHRQQGNVYFSHVHTIIIDEVDTMLMQGFGSDIRAILRTVLQRKKEEGGEAQLVMATATLTKAVKSLLSDVQGGFNIEYSDPTNKTPKKLTGNETRIELEIVEVDGLHRSLPNVQHIFEETKGQDKISLLKDTLRTTVSSTKATVSPKVLVFCNTVDSARAVEYALNDEYTLTSSSASDSSFHMKRVLSYHGELNSKEREANLEAFREGETRVLVCTDLAARGLDIPTVDQVIMFDFPLNPVDYIHRAGRCGRAGRKGKVTSLLTKRDMVLANAIQEGIKNKMPLDALSSDKKAYEEPKPRSKKPSGPLKSRLFSKERDGKSSSRPFTRSASGSSPRPASGRPSARPGGGYASRDSASRDGATSGYARKGTGSGAGRPFSREASGEEGYKGSKPSYSPRPAGGGKGSAYGASSSSERRGLGGSSSGPRRVGNVLVRNASPGRVTGGQGERARGGKSAGRR